MEDFEMIVKLFIMVKSNNVFQKIILKYYLSYSFNNFSTTNLINKDESIPEFKRINNFQPIVY